jgi:long-chain acyl-CoA synthetase
VIGCSEQSISRAGHDRHRRHALEAMTVAEAFQLTAERHAGDVALRTRNDEVSLTWREYADRVRAVAAGFAELGVTRGDTVALVLSNRPEFHIIDAAALHLGAIPFSIYNTSAVNQVAHLLRHSGSRVVVTERSLFDRVGPAAAEIGIEHIVVVDGDGAGGAMSLAALESPRSATFDFDGAWRAVQPDDVATLIYTSGTTGPPKGVEITHANVLAVLRAYSHVVDFPASGRVVSWLPMAHIAERACSHYLPMVYGYSSTSCPDPREVMQYVAEVHPTWFFAVPRVWEKLKRAIEAQLSHEAQHAIQLSLRRTRALQARQEVPQDVRDAWPAIDALVLEPLRRRIGLDRLSSVNVGAAPTSPEVIEFFHALGVPLAELWGMSESCGCGCVNPPRRVKIGTVGKPLPGFEVKLAPDNEILLKGPGVMRGYRSDPEKTADALAADGWLRTGDVGVVDEDGYLTIVDRKKDLIINSSGKNMSPANIEAALKTACPLIGQAVAIGDRRPYNVALLTLDPDATRAFASKHGLLTTSLEPLALSIEVHDAVARGVKRANQRLARVEQIKRFKLLGGEWQPGGDELTPTQKLKRTAIAEKYADEIEALYAPSETP